MSSVAVIFAGLLLVYSGITNRIDPLITALREPPSGYVNIPPLTFLVGVVGVSIPLFSLKNRPDWINGYILLIVMATALANYNALAKFVNFVQSEV